MLSRMALHARLKILPVLMLVLGTPAGRAQTAGAQTPVAPFKEEYAAALKRVLQGDMTVDYRAFRIAGTLASGGHGSMRESAQRGAFRRLVESRDFQGALDSANEALTQNYASIVNHFDAMVACQALQKTDEAATHEKLLNALLDSIQQSGDGKSPETAWFVVTTTEEYVFLSRVLGLKAKSQAFVPQGGHFYDRLEVIDPKTNESHSVWFNTDVDMGAFQKGEAGRPNQEGAPKNAAH